MIRFIDLPGGWKTFILCLMLLLNLYQFGYLFMLYMHKKIRLLLLNLLPTAFIFAAMPLLGNSVHNDSGCLKDAPVAAILLIWLLIGIYTAVSIISESRKASRFWQSRRSLTCSCRIRTQILLSSTRSASMARLWMLSGERTLKSRQRANGRVIWVKQMAFFLFALNR